MESMMKFVISRLGTIKRINGLFQKYFALFKKISKYKNDIWWSKGQCLNIKMIFIRLSEHLSRWMSLLQQGVFMPPWMKWEAYSLISASMVSHFLISFSLFLLTQSTLRLKTVSSCFWRFKLLFQVFIGFVKFPSPPSICLLVNHSKGKSLVFEPLNLDAWES